MARTDDLMDIDGGLGYCVEAVNVDHGVRFNSSFAYIDPARHRREPPRDRRRAGRERHSEG